MRKYLIAAATAPLLAASLWSAEAAEGRCQSNSDVFGGNADHPISNFD
jgi:hypothetical protein